MNALMPQRWKWEVFADRRSQMTTDESGEWCKADEVAAALEQADAAGVTRGRKEILSLAGFPGASAPEEAGYQRGVEAMRDAVPWHEPAFRKQVHNIATRLLLSAPGAAGWHCKARASSVDPPQDCDWPHCGCDPHAEKVVSALIEEGWAPGAGDRYREVREAFVEGVLAPVGGIEWDYEATKKRKAWAKKEALRRWPLSEPSEEVPK